MKHLVIENKIISYEYFLFQLQEFEIPTLMKNIHWSSNQSWKQARFIAYICASPYVKNIPNIDKWYPLPTEKEKMNYERLNDTQANKARDMIRSAFKINHTEK